MIFNLNSKVHLVGLLFLSTLASVVFLMFAVVPTWASNEIGEVNTTVDGYTANGSDSNGNYYLDPVEYEEFDAYDFNFYLPCDQWGGGRRNTNPTSAWNYDATCNILGDKIINTGNDLGIPAGSTNLNGMPGRLIGGGLLWACENTEYSYVGKNFNRTTTTKVRFKRQYVFYLRAFVRFEPYVINSASITSGSCVPPTLSTGDEYKCFYNFNGYSQYTTNTTTMKTNSGSLQRFGFRGVKPGDPRTPTWGGRYTAPGCDEIGRGATKASVTQRQNLNERGYGYYKLVPTYSYDTYRRTDISGNGVVYANEWSRLIHGATGSNTGFFAYSCNPAGPYEGVFSAGSLPDRSNFFTAGSCPQITWECTFASPTTVGLDRAALPPGRTYVNDRASVMRDGTPVPITFANVRVIDTTSGRTDVTGSQAAPGDGIPTSAVGGSVRNVTNISYRNIVKEGSTPFAAGVPINAVTQYFKLGNNGNRENWSTGSSNGWLNSNNHSLDRQLSFYWASMNSDSPFQAQRQYRVTADFLVPRIGGAGIGDSNGGTSGMSYEWVNDTKPCREGNSSTNSSSAPLLTSTSNPVEAVRSVNN